jgi:RHS repeat-associated protein
MVVYSYGNEEVNYTFTGQEADSSGLMNYIGRMYDPFLGRFLQADPFLDGLNRYAYVRNNPVKYVDPTGFHVHDSNCARDVGGNITCKLGDSDHKEQVPEGYDGPEFDSSDYYDQTKVNTPKNTPADPDPPSDPEPPRQVRNRDRLERVREERREQNRELQSSSNEPVVSSSTSQQPDLRAIAVQIASENESNPDHPNKKLYPNGFWTCAIVGAEIGDQWNVPIRGLLSADGMDATHRYLLRTTINGTESAIVGNVRITQIANPYQAQLLANSATFSQNLVITTRPRSATSSLGHLQVVVPGDASSKDSIMRNGAWIVQGGFAPQRDPYIGNRATMSQATHTYANRYFPGSDICQHS